MISAGVRCNLWRCLLGRLMSASWNPCVMRDYVEALKSPGDLLQVLQRAVDEGTIGGKRCKSPADTIRNRLTGLTSGRRSKPIRRKAYRSRPSNGTKTAERSFAPNWTPTTPNSTSSPKKNSATSSTQRTSSARITPGRLSGC